MQSVICFSVLTVFVGLSYGWGNIVTGEDSGSRYGRWTPSRRSYKCVGYGGLCYQTSHCCEGFVCTSKSDIYGIVDGVGLCKKIEGHVGLPQGAKCEDTSDCDTYAGLCCQDVSIWRVGMKRMCHKKRTVTKCIYTSLNDI